MNATVAWVESLSKPLFVLSIITYAKNKLKMMMSAKKAMNGTMGITRNSIGIDVVSIATPFAVIHDAGAPSPWPGCGPGR